MTMDPIRMVRALCWRAEFSQLSTLNRSHAPLAWLSSLIRFDIHSHYASVGLGKSSHVDFGSDSDWSVFLLNLGSFRDDNRPLRDHPDPQEWASRQLLNDSFKVSHRGFFFGIGCNAHCDSQNKCEDG